MSGLVNELLDILTEEAGFLETLVQLAKEKKTPIIKNDIETLKGLNGKENDTAGKIQRLERQRLTLVKEIANVLNEKTEAVTLPFLSESLAGQPESKAISAVSVRLKAALSSLKMLNGQNKVLIENALDYIDFSINVMRGALGGGPALYSATGEELSAEKNFFDVKN